MRNLFPYPEESCIGQFLLPGDTIYYHNQRVILQEFKGSNTFNNFGCLEKEMIFKALVSRTGKAIQVRFFETDLLRLVVN